MIIGFAGKRKSGKDTCSDLIDKMVKDEHILFHYSFGQFVKAEISFALADETQHEKVYQKEAKQHMIDMADPEKKENYRELMQAWGKFRRQQDARYWINRLISQVKAHRDKMPQMIPVIRDIRHQNEHDCLKEIDQEVLTIKVIRPDFEREGHADQDVSETDVDLIQCDYEIINDGTIEDLIPKLREIIPQEYLR